MEIHIDALGGMAGDMFAAALLDAFPEYEAGVLQSIAAASQEFPVRGTLIPHNDGVLVGHRFKVELISRIASDHRATVQAHETRHDGHHNHYGHRHWSDIRASLEVAKLSPAVRIHALAIFGYLAIAEAKVHGLSVEDVAFHEVGAWDSIADIVAAAHLIDALGGSTWSVGALPLGSGRISTAHGLLPVPAPATTILLRGFAVVDDGIPGERVTPTGAAILRYLCDPVARPKGSRVLGRTGIGFGTRDLPGMSNCVRVLTFDETDQAVVSGHRKLGVIEFEVDDQSAEDLGMGLDRLREHADIFDVVHMAMVGKKGRLTTYVRVLARADAIEAVAAACFRETTTIGLRHHVVEGQALPRAAAIVEVDGHAIRVKTVERPGGRTAKAEADDALAHAGHAARATLRREAERLALAGDAG
jgi:uncharacterized protein (TIGR00299 family) protein